jgi:hypothetical protein
MARLELRLASLMSCLIVFAVCIASQADAGRRAKVLTRALTIKEMSQRAELVVQGVVTEAGEVKRVVAGLGPAPVDLFEYKLKLFKVLKGNASPGETITITQMARLSVRVDKDEELLLYLSEPSRFGFRAPLGLYSGHFKVVTRSEDKGRFRSKGSAGKSVVNLRGNKGLFAREDAPRIESEIMRRSLQPTSPRSLPSPGDPAASKELPARPVHNYRKILRQRDPGSIPLELLEDATRTFAN